MTKADLTAQVAANTDMTKKDADKAVNAVFEALSNALANGEKVTISGFGTFEVRERAERQGINPRTQEPITIAASRSERLPVTSTPSTRCRKGPPRADGRQLFVCQRRTAMRLDKYLKVSRLIKRRTVANEVADAGRILINGKAPGDVIEITFGNRPVKVRVLSDAEPRTKDVAREMYEIISEGAPE